MSHFHFNVKKVFIVILAQALAIFLAWVFTIPFYHLVNDLLGEPKVTDVGLNISYTTAALVGFIPALAFFISFFHFAIFKKLKIYFIILLIPSIYFAFAGPKFALLELAFIFSGFLLGSLIRFIYNLIFPSTKKAPSR